MYIYIYTGTKVEFPGSVFVEEMYMICHLSSSWNRHVHDMEIHKFSVNFQYSIGHNFLYISYL